MRLVREAHLHGDYRERRIRLDELAGRRFDPQPSHILPHGTAVALPELAGEVNRVNSNPSCNGAEAQGLVIMSVESLSCSSQPNRVRPERINPLPRSETGSDLQHQALDGEGTGEYPQPALLVKPHRKPRQVRILKAERLSWQCGVIANMRQPAIRDFGDQTMEPGTSRPVGMDFAGGAKK